MIAWAAGLFEGEGSFTINATRPTRHGRQAAATMVSTDLDVLERFRDTVGMGLIRPFKVAVGRKPAWRWSVQSKGEFRRFGEMMRPYLGQRRLARLDEILLQLTDYELRCTCGDCRICRDRERTQRRRAHAAA